MSTVSDLNPPEVQVLIQSGLELAYVEAFDSAQIYIDEIIEAYPENPAGYFFRAALVQLYMMDACEYSKEKEYLSLIKETTKRAEEILKAEENLWAEFYLASTYAYRAVFEGYKKNYFETFRLGVKGGTMLQGIVRKDSTFYDAYLGAGTYEYFWARAARYLPILKLMGGDINEAIRKLHVAADKSIYAAPTARNSLAFIYGEEGEYDTAIDIIDSLLSEYPESKTFLWNKAFLEFNRENYLLAADLYAQLYARYDAENKKNYSNLAQCKLFVGKCLLELKEKEQARSALKEVIGFKKYSDTYPQIKDYCREAYGMLSRIL
ncbi:MAG: hypothetical protein JSV97_13585 [candidate division WOR-3 bacterium]|nr:MAG: hypothetical protein JSV97_13585 [candidate division WOR-3 bacterium]